MTSTKLIIRSQAAVIALAFTASVVFAPIALACETVQSKGNDKEKVNNGLALAKGIEKHSEVVVVEPKEQPEIPVVPINKDNDKKEVKVVDESKPKSNGQTSSTSTTTPSTQTPPAPSNPTGNNGTLKVHEYGTERAFINNDPKVCAFNFEGFGFDVGQDGYIIISGQGQSNGQYGPYSFGPTVADAKFRSFAETLYFNIAGGPVVANGHYKATLYGKDTGGNVNLKDEKAKSKVFKVECETTPTTPTTPTIPSTPVESATDILTAATTATTSTVAQTPDTLPSTGSDFVVMAAIATTIAGFVGFVSYVLRFAYLKTS